VVLAVVIVLLVIGVAALVTVPLMIRSTRRQQVTPGRAIGRQPLLGSDAQVWTARGERVLRELDVTLAEQPAFAAVAGDAGQVVTELRLTAGQVAELDHALAAIPTPSLEQERQSLTVAVARAQGTPEVTDLTRSLEAVTARLAAAGRQRGQRDALLARMRATVTELERARDELGELITGTTSAFPVNTGATADLTSRLDGLREGLAEVRGAADPEIGPAGQGHP
jgi:hypothetical protein